MPKLTVMSDLVSAVSEHEIRKETTYDLFLVVTALVKARSLGTESEVLC